MGWGLPPGEQQWRTFGVDEVFGRERVPVLLGLEARRVEVLTDHVQMHLAAKKFQLNFSVAERERTKGGEDWMANTIANFAG